MVTVAVEVAIAGWFAKATISKLIDKALSYCKSCRPGMKDKLRRLARFRPQIETLVYAAERGDIRRARNLPLEDWLGQLRDALEEADNLLDEMDSRPLKGKKVIVKCFKRLGQHDGRLRRLRQVVKTFDDLVSGLGIFAQVLTSLTEHVEVRGDINQETSSVFTGNEFFGRKEEIQMVINWLTTSNSKKLSVFSIVGVSGVGKTALTQYLFDQKELGCFETKIWISVSSTFDEKAITKKILESLTNKEPNIDTLNVAQRTLKELLSTKKFLLVLDNVWNDEERGKWEKLMAPLRHGAEGSKILLTTRMDSVADMVAKVVGESRMSLNLSGLEERENMLLFEKYAFAGFDPKDYPRLQSIGNEITMKLRGIPLAVKTIGGMLNSKLDDEYWTEVLEDGTLNSDKGTDGIMTAIRLSYEHLSPELKPCFRYCGIFPQDHKFNKEQVVDMWLSVGLIPGGEKRPEEVAIDFFETFVQKSFFEHKNSYYIMHDLFHELAQILSKHECLRVVTNEPIQMPQNIRHLSLTTNEIRVLKNLEKLKYVRTLLLYCDIEDAELRGAIDTALRGLKTLRYLELSSRHLCDFPESIGNLVHLRCLRITRTNISKLSSCICMLYNLQILDFKLNYHLNSIGSIPSGICKLSKLRKLDLPKHSILQIPYIGKLTSLQRLEEYSVRREVGHYISELDMMSELQELMITNLQNVNNTEEASKAKLTSKQHLRCVTLSWQANDNNDFDKEIANDSHKEIADCLQPHHKLTKLSLSGYRSTNPPNWLEDQILPNLTTIKLLQCHILEKLPPLGQLPYLKCLILHVGVKKIGSEFYGFSRTGNTFPALEILVLENLVKLEEWIEDDQSEMWLPCLKILVADGCPSLKRLPPIPVSLKELKLNSLGIDKLPEFKHQNEGNNTNQGLELLSLIITNCSELTSLSSGLFSQPGRLTSLKELTISNCVELVHLPLEGFRELISLKLIRIKECTKIFLLPILLPKIFFPPSVQQVMLSCCGDLVASLPQLLHGLSFLSHLKLEQCSNLRSLPSKTVLQCLISLKQLELLKCHELKSLAGLEAITTLKILIIRKCSMLTTSSQLNSIEESPRNTLSMALEQLDIDCPEQLLLVPLRSLHLTKRVFISEFYGMTSLLEEWLLQNGPYLQTLGLDCLDSMESLPDSLQNLTSLRILILNDAFGLTSLPELPRSLEMLIIDGCSEDLARRLDFGGLDYDKIRHLDVVVSGVFETYLFS
ncbi:hypothetical protein LUZ63_001233 [Rhynchospora breviuscula]|uniref:Uncharacterized protein n=1 Tax=Rhynchospora breviuscula TaxID=2022672 RepID=A0A9Q0CWF4_9POAL|nr:hypothetical protein LUZ63_001233 [Rhynchospora breviuscula]